MGVLANNPKVYDLVASSVQVEKIATGFTFTEGPIWHPDGYLLFSDMPADVRRKWTEAEGIVEVMKPANKCNGMTLDADLNLIVCEHWTSHVVRAALNPDGTEASREVIASHYGDEELNSPNDVVVKSDGSIYFSDPTYGRMDVYGNPRELEMDVQGVYRIPPGGGELQRLADDFQQPNGLCFSPDESTLYVNDSGILHIRRYSVNADGTISGGEVILDGIGSPDDFDGGHLRRDEMRRGRGTSGSPARAESGSSLPTASTSERSRSPSTPATSTGAARTGTSSTSPRRRRSTASRRRCAGTPSPTCASDLRPREENPSWPSVSTRRSRP